MYLVSREERGHQYNNNNNITKPVSGSRKKLTKFHELLYIIIAFSRSRNESVVFCECILFNILY